jgi:putative ABC transport system permease protein
VMVILVVGLVTGILAGIYPAFFLSGLNTINVLKGAAFTRGTQRKLLRSGLVIFQFFVSTTLIIATIIVYQQLHFMQNKKLGYDKDHVLFVSDARVLGTNQMAFKQDLLQDSRVVSATMSRSIPGGDIMDGTEIFPRNDTSNGTEIHANIAHVDFDYIRTLGIQIKKGRYFSKEFPTDSQAVVINEAAVRELGWTNDNAVGKTIVRSGQQQFRVLGVVADFNYASVREKIAPMMMLLGNNAGGVILKIQTADITGFLGDLRKHWAAFNPSAPLEYSFLDEKFASLYASERRTQQIFSAFTILAIIIAGLGLFGLSAYMMEQRTREIGIRKVLGASVKQVLTMVSREFLWLVLISFFIAIPVTWWAMNNWLHDFAYRIQIQPYIFLGAGVLVMLTALLAIGVQALKAAISNPVKSLRSE